MKDHEEHEQEIHNEIMTNTVDNFKYRNYNEKALDLLKPTLCINKLVS